MTKKREFTIEKSRVYDAEYIPPEMVISLKIDDEVVGAAGTLVVLSGLPKNGKSLFLSSIISSYFLRESFLKMQLILPKEKPVITVFDTENGVHNFYKNINYIKQFSNGEFKKNYFKAYRLRGFSPAEMIDKIKAYIESDPLCGCLVIDGFVDMVMNVNDAYECANMGILLKQITNDYGITILGVLHTNRGGNDTTGHLGAMCDRACNATLLVKKNKETKCFELSPVFLRDAKKDFDIVSIKFFDNKLELMANDNESSSKPRTYKDWTPEEHRGFATKSIKELGEPYKDIIATIQENAAIGISAAKSIMSVWIAEKIVYKGPSNLYFYNVKH